MANLAREAIKKIQHELARRGFSPGVIDGIPGRRTEGAVRRFQAAHGLLVDGVVGPQTRRALFGAADISEPINDPAIPWFQEARRLIGVREVVGPGNQPKIIDWATKTGIDYKSDDIPWCGLFVAHCISSTLLEEPLPANPLGARNWMKFGAPGKLAAGAILVFWRGKKEGWQGHAGFYAGQDSAAYHVLGGNQGDSVSITRIRRDRLLDIRWPATAPFTDGGPINLADGDTIFSNNEA